jgi:hypothetical protein
MLWERARGRLRTGTASPYPAIYAGPSIVTPLRQSTQTAGRQAQAPLILAPKLPSFHPRGGRAVDFSIHGQRNRLTGPPIFGTPAPAPLFCRIGRLFLCACHGRLGRRTPPSRIHRNLNLSLASIHARSLLEVFSCSNLSIRPAPRPLAPHLPSPLEGQALPLAMFPGASMAS